MESQTVNSVEVKPLDLKLNLLYGNHPTTIPERIEVDNKLNSGAIDTSIWSNLQFEKTYSGPPNIIAVDGLFPVSDLPLGQTKFSDTVNRDLYSSIPKEFKTAQKDEMLIVLGDVGGFRSAIANELSQEEVDNKKVTDTLFNKNGEFLNNTTIDESSRYAISPIALSIFGIISGIIGMSDEEVMHANQAFKYRKEMPPQISRRVFLKLMGLGALAVAPAVIAPQFFKGHVSGKNELEKIVKTFTHNFTNYVDTDGRTALFITKAQDASKFLKQDNVGIVAGTAHEHNINNLVSDENARFDAIRNLAKLLLEVGDATGKDAGLSSDRQQLVSNSILDFMERTQIVSVKKIDKLKVEPGEIEDTLREAISLKADMRSESVKKALLPLRTGGNTKQA
jgi:hypothetical protein